MIFPPIFEISFVGVSDPGIPNQERLVFRPTERVNLGQYGVLLGVRTSEGSIVPVWDHFFWFGEFIAEPPSWIVIYTGSGQYKESTVPDTGHKVHFMYLGKPRILFDNPSLVPVLFRMDSILIGSQIIQPSQKQLNR